MTSREVNVASDVLVVLGKLTGRTFDFFCLLSCSRSRHKENMTLKTIDLETNDFGDEGRAALREAEEVWAFAPGVLLWRSLVF